MKSKEEKEEWQKLKAQIIEESKAKRGQVNNFKIFVCCFKCFALGFSIATLIAVLIK